MPTDSPIIVALDVLRPEAVRLATALRGRVHWLKVGMTLFYAEGPAVVTELQELGFGVFLDLKLNDIPHQVAGAASAITRLGVGMFTVHASGGGPMMRAAVEASRRTAEEAGITAPAVLAVTVLTSTGDEGLGEIGVLRLAALSVEAGVDGLVCSPVEAAAVRSRVGDELLVVTPGVRPSWAEAGDQSRIATPRAALEAGASHLVIGRPITAASDPSVSVDRILHEIEGMDR
jgi:orotidine-5'-phosphate decarboxylase